MSFLLGVDCGLSVTKAVVFDENARPKGSGAVNNTQRSPHPRWVEQDMEELWESCRDAIRVALREAGIGGAEVAGIGIAGYGDSVFLVDGAGRPVRPAVLSLDSRASGVLDRWKESEVSEKVGGIGARSRAVLGWIREHEPEALESTRWVLSAKDWLRYRLTGEYATDPTEASAGYADLQTRKYAPELLSLYDLEEIQDRLPPITGCAEVAGEVAPEAAEATGLATGTPVVAGAHDIDASAVGVGCTGPGVLVVIAGTWCNNEVVSDQVVTGRGWICRNFVEPGLWMNVSGSPGSASNLEWFVRQLCPVEVEQAKKNGKSPFDFIGAEVEGVLDERAEVFYHPFLYGSPYGGVASGGFFGLRGWHTRAHFLRALLEGITFNHKTHADILESHFGFNRVRLTGGGARSALWSQMFADVLDFPVEVTDVEETGSLGAAILAGIGVGVYDSLEDARERTIRILRTHEPDPEGHDRLAEAYETYKALVEAMIPLWPRLDEGAVGEGP